MNRNQLQALAEERVEDAKALLDRGRWSAAYYLAGYAVECGLKACVLRYISESDALFGDPKYRKDLGDVWTHDLVKLVGLAGLSQELEQAFQHSTQFGVYWSAVKLWKEVSRYETKTETEARQLFEAITDPNEGVLGWIRTHW